MAHSSKQSTCGKQKRREWQAKKRNQITNFAFAGCDIDGLLDELQSIERVGRLFIHCTHFGQEEKEQGNQSKTSETNRNHKNGNAIGEITSNSWKNFFRVQLGRSCFSFFFK